MNIRSLLLVVGMISCISGGKEPETDEVDFASISDCESCLKNGGAWQPEIEHEPCNPSCAWQDVSCFLDECPECTEESCGCFSEQECLEVNCNWIYDDFGSYCVE